MTWLIDGSWFLFGAVCGGLFGHAIARHLAAREASELTDHWFKLAICRIDGRPVNDLPKPLADAIVRKAELVARENARLGRALADIVNDTKADGEAARDRARKALEGRDVA